MTSKALCVGLRMVPLYNVQGFVVSKGIKDRYKLYLPFNLKRPLNDLEGFSELYEKNVRLKLNQQ